MGFNLVKLERMTLFVSFKFLWKNLKLQNPNFLQSIKNSSKTNKKGYKDLMSMKELNWKI